MILQRILLYAAGTRQINKAIHLGIHKGQNKIALVMIGDKHDFSEFDEISHMNVLDYNKYKKTAIMQIFWYNTRRNQRCWRRQNT